MENLNITNAFFQATSYQPDINSKKIEEGAVDGFNKVTDKAVEKLFKKDGETVEEAKERLSGKNK